MSTPPIRRSGLDCAGLAVALEAGAEVAAAVEVEVVAGTGTEAEAEAEAETEAEAEAEVVEVALWVAALRYDTEVRGAVRFWSAEIEVEAAGAGEAAAGAGAAAGARGFTAPLFASFCPRATAA
jgi:hypothetical protein